MKPCVPLLTVKDLQVYFTAHTPAVCALNTISLTLSASQKIAIIGETGSGKTVLAEAILGLLPDTARLYGKISWQGRNLRDPVLLNSLRGRELVFIPQNPLSSLNPVLTIGTQIGEAVRRVNPSLSQVAVKQSVLELMNLVGLNKPSLYQAYPHQLSGGMGQRVLLAIGLAGQPRLVIADEPTKGLDIATRNHTVHLLHASFADSALLLITHDIEVAATCDYIVVMYAGEALEIGLTEDLLTHPLHPYTKQLLAAHPNRGMNPIPGHTPSLTQLPVGCRFSERCSLCKNSKKDLSSNCYKNHPKLTKYGNSIVRCWYAQC